MGARCSASWSSCPGCGALRPSPSSQRRRSIDVVHAIGARGRGRRIRVLELPKLVGPALKPLLRYLTVGHLPQLRVLELPVLDKEIDALALAKALEKRHALGLPPVTRLVAPTPHQLPRIWACCPPALVKHLEAGGREWQVEALGEYMAGV
jgi:hypothetical protein